MHSASIGIIGGADGPTVIYVSSGFPWIRFSGFVIVFLILLPNLLYALRGSHQAQHTQSRLLNLLEQIGRYGCMALMVFPFGAASYGFSSVFSMLVYFLGNAILLLLYWILWFLYFRKVTFTGSIALAVVPTLIFLLSGITLRHTALILSALLFGYAHIRITYTSVRE